MAAPETEPAITLRQTCTPPAVVAILLAEAKRKGVSVTIDGDQLRVRGPRAVAPLIQELVARKVEIIALSVARAAHNTTPTHLPPSTAPASECRPGEPADTGTEPEPDSTTHAPAPPDQPSSECEALLAELRDLAGRVVPHWRTYIEIRMEADRLDPDGLLTARDWVLKYATIDGVPGPGSVFATPDVPDELDAGRSEAAP